MFSFYILVKYRNSAVQCSELDNEISLMKTDLSVSSKLTFCKMIRGEKHAKYEIVIHANKIVLTISD